MLKARLALLAALLAVGGFVAWLSLTDPDSPTAAPAPLAASPIVPDPDPRGGSVVPCAAPLGWRVAGVDPRFELGEAQVTAAVERAVASWERAVGRPLFVHDPSDGLPIQFVYDQRQATAIERRRLEQNIAAVDERLRAERRVLEDRAAAYDVRRALYEGSVRELERRSEAHADTIRRWNASGGAPAALVPDLEASGQALDRERLELMRVADELERERVELQADVDELNRRVDERGRGMSGLTDALTAQRIESGMYRELIGRRGDSVVALQRAIDVYRFDSVDDLWLVVAHELGHALGLGHSASTGAVMSEEYRRVDRAVTDIQPDDLALLAATCPALVVSGPRPP